MSEIALRDTGAAAAVPPPAAPVTSAIVSLTEWAAELEAAGSIAVKLCQTPFVPAHFRGKPADAAAAILTGHELGLSPMASLRSIFLISGTPGMYAKVMVAVVQAQGHRVWIPEQSPERVVVCGQRRGEPHVTMTVWDRARVVTAKLTSNAMYQTNPQAMMVARGQSEICRQVAPDALYGVPYSYEELQDMPAEGEDSAGVVTASEIFAITPAPAAAPTEPPAGRPATPPPAEEPAPPPPAEPGITQPQQRKLHALLNQTGRGDRDIGLVYIAGVIERDLASTKELTKEEAKKVIDRLESDPPEPADESWPAASQPPDAEAAAEPGQLPMEIPAQEYDGERPGY